MDEFKRISNIIANGSSAHLTPEEKAFYKKKMDSLTKEYLRTGTIKQCGVGEITQEGYQIQTAKDRALQEKSNDRKDKRRKRGPGITIGKNIRDDY